MSNDERRYRLDYDWLWATPPHNDGAPATVRLTVRDGACFTARTVVMHWLETMPADSTGMRGRGGWLLRSVPVHDRSTVVLELTSAGEDVADGIEAATEEAYDALLAETDLTAQWEQLPRG